MNPSEGTAERGLDVAARLSVGPLELDATLQCAPGETITLVGPNGAGKTSLLRAVAGLVALQAGAIHLHGTPLDDPAAGVFVPPARRRIGVVFQDGALFGHMSALENAAFGLRATGVRAGEARAAAHRWLVRLEVDQAAGARVDRLSGGQRQRVALARALAARPRALLLDEPFSALDASARVALRHVVARHLDEFEGPRVIVTHDPVEALTLGDRVVVMDAGRVVQHGTAAEIRAQPRARYVGDLLGVNLLHGTHAGDVLEVDGGGRIVVADHAAAARRAVAVVHPRAVALHTDEPHGSPRNTWTATVTSLDDDGVRVRVGLQGAVPLMAEITHRAGAALGLRPGSQVWVALKATDVTLQDA